MIFGNKYYIKFFFNIYRKMNTAKTLQLLDANNNNISPAVCVDSLYFEKTESGTTYRMSLKNRMLVAGSVITTNLNPTGSQLQDIAVPMFTISKVSGSADVSLYQLNCSTYNIGSYINNAINASLATTYYSKEQSESIFVKIDGANCVSTYLYIGASGQNGTSFKNPKISALRLIADGDTSSGLDWNAGGDHLYVDTAHNADIYTANSVNIKSNVINLNTPTGSTPTTYVNVNGINDIVDVNANTFKVTANSSIELTANKYGFIHATNQFDINVDDGTLNLYNERGNINLNTNSSDGHVRIYERDFTKPDINIVDNNAMGVLVTSKTGTSYDWKQLPILQVASNESLRASGSIIYMDKNGFNMNSSIILKDILFYGDGDTSTPFVKDCSTTLVDYDRNLNTDIAIKGINSGDFYTTLLGDNNKKCIQVATINGKPMVRDINLAGTFNYDVLVTNDISTFATLKPINAGNYPNSFRVWGSSGSDFNSLLNNKTCNVGAIESVYFKSSGAMYAQSFYASSDERLKTEIQTPEITNSVPDIKKFIWKDSSTVSYGFIAQDLENAGYPEIVSEDDNGFKKVDYNAALSLKIASIQQENEKLKDRIKELESIVSEILTKVNNI